MAITLQPGTVLVTRSTGFAGWWIRLGAALRNKPNLHNHVAVVHHTDAQGTLWVIEGKPGGVGWRDATDYLKSRWTLTNSAQPVTAVQGAAIAKQMEILIGTDYDWEAIAADALSDLGMKLPGWDAKFKGTVAGQLVCSSAAAYAYGKASVSHPEGDRAVQPADWSVWIVTKGWES